VGLAIHLLGAPGVERDGQPAEPPRGRKVWGLLAFLLRSERPVSRDRLVSLLFAEADDPYAALRWNLSAIRRLLPEASIDGDPVRLVLPEGGVVDVNVLLSGTTAEALALPGLERELLEGAGYGFSPAFETWLLMERRHLQGAGEALLREGVLMRLAVGDAEAATGLAARLVRMNPYDESFQVLLVRSLTLAGDAVAAVRQAASCRELFLRELGVDPGPALAAAQQVAPAPPSVAPRAGRASARAQLEAGEAAISAGSIEPGLACFRRAVSDASAIGDIPLQARALLALGSALVHAARGRDEEASAALHEVVAIAEGADVGFAAAAAARELGHVEFLRGRYDRALVWLHDAGVRAAGDRAELARVACTTGAVLTDTAHYVEAVERLEEAVALADAAQDGRQLAYALSMQGRVHLLLGGLERAGVLLDRSLACARGERWTAFEPWPESLRGDVDLALGHVDAAEERYEHAFALGCQVGDPCWEGVAARGLGAVAAARGQVDEAITWFLDARQRSVRLPDGYRWVDAYTLDALAALAVDRGDPRARAWANELALLAAGAGMRELLCRAYGHQAALGDRVAATAAAALSDEIDTPLLRQATR
jgi:DNA-binding SARP family transcriptional activator